MKAARKIIVTGRHMDLNPWLAVTRSIAKTEGVW